ncbi:hypothetical protein JZ751_020974 [Albula glossodonta]|uniref:Uncharacterized protein n=1 Tax=Albula glossodonta TaxID=121402 RepID=A0A8T2PK22_9TELE|nr:hypothetical protein JZ751_020974 [Albula glossodonta]
MVCILATVKLAMEFLLMLISPMKGAWLRDRDLSCCMSHISAADLSFQHLFAETLLEHVYLTKINGDMRIKQGRCKAAFMTWGKTETNMKETMTRFPVRVGLGAHRVISSLLYSAVSPNYSRGSTEDVGRCNCLKLKKKTKATLFKKDPGQAWAVAEGLKVIVTLRYRFLRGKGWMAKAVSGTIHPTPPPSFGPPQDLFHSVLTHNLPGGQAATQTCLELHSPPLLEYVTKFHPPSFPLGPQLQHPARIPGYETLN